MWVSGSGTEMFPSLSALVCRMSEAMYRHCPPPHKPLPAAWNVEDVPLSSRTCDTASPCDAQSLRQPSMQPWSSHLQDECQGDPTLIPESSAEL